MLDVDTPGAGAGQIADQLFEGWGALPWILPKQLDELLRFVPEPAASDFPGVFLRLGREDDAPGARRFYQPGFSDVFESEVRSPLRMDSRIPGIDRR